MLRGSRSTLSGHAGAYASGSAQWICFHFGSLPAKHPILPGRDEFPLAFQLAVAGGPLACQCPALDRYDHGAARPADVAAVAEGAFVRKRVNVFKGAVQTGVGVLEAQLAQSRRVYDDASSGNHDHLARGRRVPVSGLRA